MYAGLLLRKKRPTQAMRAWVRHVFRTSGAHRYRSSPVIPADIESIPLEDVRGMDPAA